MTIVKWYGHSCFKIEFDNGVSVLTDPFNKKSYDGIIRYKADFEKTDIVTVSHGHKDHNFIPFTESRIADKPEEFEFKGVKVSGFKTFHDKSGGALRGENIVFKISDGKCTFIHSGDLGCMPDSKLTDFIRGCDCLMIPVGGKYTIDAGEAKAIADEASAGIIFPMHYKNEYIDFDISPVSYFLAISEERTIETVDGSEISITCAEKGKIVVFNL